MHDLIERQAAIEALEREKTYCRAFREGYAPVDVFEKYNAGLTDGIKAISSLPSAQPDNSCDGCRYENANDGVLVPCGFCKRSHPDNYERRTDEAD